MAPRVPPLPETCVFEGKRDYPIENKVDDWGLTPEQQETYVEHFRRKIHALGLYQPDHHDYFTLRRFLRARTYDFERAIKMWTDHMHWRQEHRVDTLLQDFYFNERDKFLEAYPQGYHKLDKIGRPVYIQLIGKINVPAIMKCTDEDRMFKFHVQEYERCVKIIMPVCSKLAGRKIDQTFGIMDVKGVGVSALTGDVKRMLGKFTKTDQDNYPEMLGHICIINAPAIFRMLWSVVKGMIDVRTQQKIEILGPNYMDSLLKHMDIQSIPEFLGGKSPGTLLDDSGPWSDAELMAAHGIDMEALRAGNASLGAPAGPALASPSFGRPSNEQRLSSGFVTPAGSMARSAGSASGTVRVSSDGNGVASAPSASGAAAAASAAAATASMAALTSIAEARSRTLMEQVKALEAMLPLAQADRLRPPGSARKAASVRVAPEGSLLNRVEVLEDVLETVLAAQQTLVTQMQQQAAAQNAAVAAVASRAAAAEARAAASEGCCTIM